MITANLFSQTLEKILPPGFNSPLAVAVSGGADSLCLTLLLNEWAKKHNIRLIALTVDHKLRADSTLEALQVNNWLRERGIEHHILTWAHSGEHTNIQTTARRARYALLENWCTENGVSVLALGHHQGDQVETVLQRLGHHSGPLGLAGIANVREQGSIKLIRPLLGFSKSVIMATMQDFHQEWIEDPSNQNSSFTRIKIRQRLLETENPSFTDSRILKLQHAMATYRIKTESEALAFMDQYVTLHTEGYCEIQTDALSSLQPSIKELVLRELLKVISGHEYHPTDATLTTLQTRALTHQVVCCHGCVLLFKKQHVLIMREFNNIGHIVHLTSGKQELWDNRFLVSSSHEGDLRIKALGAHWQKLKHNTPILSLPYPVRLALPSFWQKERLLSVPNLGYYEGPEEISECKALFYPRINLCRSRFIFG